MTKKEQIIQRIVNSALPVSTAELANSLGFTRKYVQEVLRGLLERGDIASVVEDDGIPRYKSVSNTYWVDEIPGASTRHEDSRWVEAYDKGYADAKKELEDMEDSTNHLAYKAGRREAIRQIIEKLGFNLSEVV